MLQCFTTNANKLPKGFAAQRTNVILEGFLYSDASLDYHPVAPRYSPIQRSYTCDLSTHLKRFLNAKLVDSVWQYHCDPIIESINQSTAAYWCAQLANHRIPGFGCITPEKLAFNLLLST
jgi:hypothetical protein